MLCNISETTTYCVRKLFILLILPFIKLNFNTLPVQQRGILPLRGQQRGPHGGHRDTHPEQERTAETPASVHEAETTQ